MTSRIVVFGATGYTGRLVVNELARRGASPVLAGRSPERLEALGARYGGMRIAVADASDPASVRSLVGRGDLLVTTVGPYHRWGSAALEAALAAGAHYLDVTGEADVVRAVCVDAAARAVQAGSALLCGFGFDFVPGHLAGALAVRAAGGQVTQLDIAYQFTGDAGLSSGTTASAVGSLDQRTHAWRSGRLVTEPFGRTGRRFRLGGADEHAVCSGGTEPVLLPRVFPELTDVTVYLAGVGEVARWTMPAISRVAPALLSLAPVRAAYRTAAERLATRTGTGPDAEQRAASGSLVRAEARDADGEVVATVELIGPNAYDLTARLVADAALRVAAAPGGLAGAVGPLDVYGLEGLRRSCALAGLVPREASPGG